jgi:hypothetical protein
MSNHLEKFVRENREDFDGEMPDIRVLEKIQQKMNPQEPEKTKPVVVSFKRWLSAAAVVIFLAGAGMMYLLLHRETVPPLAGISNHKPLTDTVKADIAVKADSPSKQANPKNATVKTISPEAKDEYTETSDEYAEEIVHYARLAEIKHHELKRLEKDEPLLYKQFAGDVSKLDSVYNTLKTQLPKNPNRGQLIEAMIQNLQLQIGLLNRQLDIIKQINHSKKSAYEKAYKSV